MQLELVCFKGVRLRARSVDSLAGVVRQVEGRQGAHGVGQFFVVRRHLDGGKGAFLEHLALVVLLVLKQAGAKFQVSAPWRTKRKCRPGHFTRGK